jgi:MFS family permease
LAVLIGELIRHDMMEYSYLMVIALLLGIANAFYNNARQSYVVELTGKSTLTNAIALSSTVYNLSKFVVPVIAGFLIVKYGYTTCFYINAITYIPLIFILKIIQNQKEVSKKANKRITFSLILDDIARGFKYVKGELRLILLLVMLFFSSISLLNYTMQVPIYAKYVLNQEAQGFGALMTFMGIGAFIGAFGIAFRVKKKPNVCALFISVFSLSIMTILLGLTKSYTFTAIMLVAVGISTVTLTVSINSFIQLITKKSMLGKITSMYTVLYIGATPIGNILAGTIDEKYGIENSFIILGTVGFVLTIIMVSIFYKKRYFKQNFNEGGFL